MNVQFNLVFDQVFLKKIRNSLKLLKLFPTFILDDLKITGTNCQIEIHFSSQTNKFLFEYNLLRFQISGGLIIFLTEHDYKILTSFIKENKRYK